VQIRNELAASLPGVEVAALHYPPPLHKRVLSSLVTVVQYSVIGGAMAGTSISGALAGTPFAAAVAGPLATLQENKLPAIGGAWFVGSSVASSLLKTGAFEVELRDDADTSKVVWSGIARGGRPPMTQQEMYDILHALRSSGLSAAQEA